MTVRGEANLIAARLAYVEARSASTQTFGLIEAFRTLISILGPEEDGAELPAWLVDQYHRNNARANEARLALAHYEVNPED